MKEVFIGQTLIRKVKKNSRYDYILVKNNYEIRQKYNTWEYEILEVVDYAKYGYKNRYTLCACINKVSADKIMDALDVNDKED